MLEVTYQVPWPNSLWHLDGHHALIHLKIVIHGCIDGVSRRIMFLRGNSNNRDFKQRQRGRRWERHKIRAKPKGPLRMTGGKQVDVLRSGPT